MSPIIKFYFTSSMLNMFRILIHPSSGACDFSVVSPHWLRVLISTCVGVSVWLVGVESVWQAEAVQCHCWSHVKYCSKLSIGKYLLSQTEVSFGVTNPPQIMKVCLAEMESCSATTKGKTATFIQ